LSAKAGIAISLPDSHGRRFTLLARSAGGTCRAFVPGVNNRNDLSIIHRIDACRLVMGLHHHTVSAM
jgi:hypothetical protein